MKIPSVNISPRVQCGKSAGKTRVSLTQLNSNLHCREFVRMEKLQERRGSVWHSWIPNCTVEILLEWVDWCWSRWLVEGGLGRTGSSSSPSIQLQHHQRVAIALGWRTSARDVPPPHGVGRWLWMPTSTKTHSHPVKIVHWTHWFRKCLIYSSS